VRFRDAVDPADTKVRGQPQIRATPRAPRTFSRSCGTIRGGEDVVDELHFEGDPERDSTRRRLERILREKEQPRSEWRWIAALAAGATALLFWQVRRRRRHGEANGGEDTQTPNGQVEDGDISSRVKTGA
jgi:hypothetical protein